MKTTSRLRQALNSGDMVVAPFVLNALHAKIAESVGFQAVYMTGAGTAAERGFPDVGLLTMTEMVTNAKYIANAIDIPVICDADTGYGNPLNVQRTVREYEAAGVAAIHLEDQLFPKKCGFFEGKQVIPVGEAVQKIHAALDARTDPDFVIIARCDAYAVTGWRTRLNGATPISRPEPTWFSSTTSRARPISRTTPGHGRPAAHVQWRPDEHQGHGRPRLQADDLRQHHLAHLSAGKGVVRGAEGHRRRRPQALRHRWDVAALLGLDEIYELERKYGVTEVPVG